jgi:M6 family metalloprotease-like protein
MRNEKWILLILLLFVSLTTAADDAVIQRGCRRSVLPQPTRAAHRAQGAPKQVGGNYYVGERHQLTVLVSFSDQQFLQEDPMPVWNLILNEPNYTETPFTGSVHDYFYAQSNSAFNLKFDLQYVDLDQARHKYRSTATDDENSKYLVNDLVDTLLKRNIDWSLYDWNGNGYINQLLIIFAGKGSSYGGFGGGYDAIWPHQLWLSAHEGTPPREVTSGDKTYYVDCYCAVQELDSSGKYGAFGTLCHEYTHCFGFPDFYGDDTMKTPGQWDLMDFGNYNSNGFCPAGYSAHERMMMGWLTPTPLSTTQTVSSMAANDAYIIYNDAYPDEYYMVENRQKTGWDSYLPGSGLVVFHVDYNENTWLSLNEWVNTSSQLCYHIFPANNQPEYSKYNTNNTRGWAYPYISNDSLTNNSKPAATLNNANTDGSKLMNKSLRDITVADGLASFRFTNDTSTGISELEAEGEPRELYRVGPVVILRYPNGVVRKVVKKN